MKLALLLDVLKKIIAFCAASPAMAPPRYPLWDRNWLRAFLLIVVVILAYWPVWHAGFVWDDDAHLTSNACIVGPLGFTAIWTTSAATYYPMVLTTFSAIHAIWGLNPLPYHLLNILLHAANALLLWQALRALDVRGAWLGAALWALHPVMVQSVAWITELKNTQSCFFFLLSTLCFLRFHERVDSQRWRLLAWSLLCFLLAITSKTSTVMLPLVLCLCVWWIDRRWSWYNQLFLLPFLLISAAASGWTIWEQQFHSGALGPEWMLSWPQRVAVAGSDIWFYLGKLLWPHPLVFLYPRWNIVATSPMAFLPAAAALGGLLAAWFYRDGRGRPFFFAGAYFVISLFPVLGFFNVYFFRYSFVSDHFQYLASMAPLALVGAGLALCAERKARIFRFVMPASALLLLSLAALTYRQCAIYSNAEVLYRSIIAQNPTSWLAHNNLGLILLQKDRPNEAILNFQAALEAKPAYSETLSNLGQAYFQKGLTDEAIVAYQKALMSDPRSDAALYNLGQALFLKGEFDQAIASYRAVLDLKPEHVEAHNNLGNALLQTGQTEKAIDQYRAALVLRPAFAEAHNNLAGALLQIGQTRDAAFHYQKSIDLNPNFGDAANTLAWILATSPDSTLRDGPRAVELALRANQLKAGLDPVAIGTLAAAYAEDSRFSQAIETAQRGLEVAKSSGNYALANVLEAHLALYRQKSPVRTIPGQSNKR